MMEFLSSGRGDSNVNINYVSVVNTSEFNKSGFEKCSRVQARHHFLPQMTWRVKLSWDGARIFESALALELRDLILISRISIDFKL